MFQASLQGLHWCLGASTFLFWSGCQRLCVEAILFFQGQPCSYGICIQRLKNSQGNEATFLPVRILALVARRLQTVLLYSGIFCQPLLLQEPDQGSASKVAGRLAPSCKCNSCKYHGRDSQC